MAQAVNSLWEGWCWAIDIKNYLINYVCKQCNCLCLQAGFLDIIIFVTIITIISSIAINSQSKNLEWNCIWELPPGHSNYNTSSEGRKIVVCFPLRRHFSRINYSTRIAPVPLFERSRSIASVGRVTKPNRKPRAKRSGRVSQKRTSFGITAREDDGKGALSFLWWRLSEVRTVPQGTSYQPYLPSTHSANLILQVFIE